MKKIFLTVALSIMLMVGGAGLATAGGNNNNSTTNNNTSYFGDVITEAPKAKAKANAEANATAVQGQIQGQVQGQLQGQGQSQNVDNTDINQNVQTNDQVNKQVMVTNTPRDFHNAPVIGFTEHIVNMSQPTDSYNVTNVMELLRFQSTFTKGDLEAMVYGNGSLKVVVDRIIKKTYGTTIINNNRVSADASIMVIVERPKGPTKLIAVLSGHGNTKDTTIQVFAKTALEAIEIGATHLYLSTQGTDRRMDGLSWGIGFNASKAKMVEGGDGSEIASGGLGVSGATSGYKNAPWVQGYALSIK